MCVPVCVCGAEERRHQNGKRNNPGRRERGARKEEKMRKIVLRRKKDSRKSEKERSHVPCVMQIVKCHVLLWTSMWARERARAFICSCDLSIPQKSSVWCQRNSFKLLFFFYFLSLFALCHLLVERVRLSVWSVRRTILHIDRFNFCDFDCEAFPYNLLESFFAHSCKRDC